MYPLRFVVFWLACAWATLLVILLALFDLLLVRAQERAARRALQEEFTKRVKRGSSEGPED